MVWDVFGLAGACSGFESPWRQKRDCIFPGCVELSARKSAASGVVMGVDGTARRPDGNFYDNPHRSGKNLKSRCLLLR